MIYAAIDTCIFVRGWSQGQSGCEMEHFRALKELMDKEEVCLLLPEIVTLEIEKNWRAFPEDLGNKFGSVKTKLEETISKPQLWSEMAEFPADLSTFLDEWKAKKRRESQTRYTEIKNLLSHRNVVPIPLTSEILLGAKRLIASGRLETKSDQDAALIVSIRDHFQAKRIQDPTLHFCSCDEAAFALDTKAGVTFRPEVKELLPARSFCYKDVRTLVEAIKTHTPPAVVPDVEVQKALEETKARERASMLPPAILLQPEVWQEIRSVLGPQNYLVQAILGVSEENRRWSEALRTIGEFDEFRRIQEMLRAIGPSIAGLKHPVVVAPEQETPPGEPKPEAPPSNQLNQAAGDKPPKQTGKK